MTKEKKEGWFNPKRMKILAGIFLIFMLGVCLDFVIPVNGRNLSHSENITLAKNTADYISYFVDEYYNLNGEYPHQIYGGDLSGYQICKNHPVDPLIEKGLINSYPEVKFNPISIRRGFISLMMNKNIKNEFCRFGKYSDRMGNISFIYDEPSIMNELITTNVNPFAGHFFYRSYESDVPNYTLLIAGDSFENSLDVINESNGLLLPDGNPDGFIYGFTVTYENGRRKKIEFIPGDNQ
ncbi:hypothetical protein KKB99_05450 [bacterium]|nr:hypothetical protein [bacterium]MBU1025442.1 hypothetical protein [bacterium]